MDSIRDQQYPYYETKNFIKCVLYMDEEAKHNIDSSFAKEHRHIPK